MDNIKRYIILKNDTPIGEGNTRKELYTLIGCSKQHFNAILLKTIETVEGCTFNGNNFNLIDKLEKLIKN